MHRVIHQFDKQDIGQSSAILPGLHPAIDRHENTKITISPVLFRLIFPVLLKSV